MMPLRKVLILTALMLLPAAALAQRSGALWLGGEVSYAIDHRWGADLEVGWRLEDGLRSFDRYDAALGFDFKASRWLKVGAGYDCIRDRTPGEAEVLYKTNPDGTPRLDSDGNRVVKGINVDDPYWRTKHRIYLDATFKGKARRLGIALRERYQFTRFAPAEVMEWKYREEYAPEELPTPLPAGAFYGPVTGDDGESYYYALDDAKSGPDSKGAKSRHHLRSRLALDYNIRRCPLTPFASYEVTLDLAHSFDVVRHRAQAGFDLNLTRDKRHALSVAYLYQHDPRGEVGSADIHALTLGYKLSLDSPRAAAQKAAAKKAKKKAKKGGK